MAISFTKKTQLWLKFVRSVAVIVLYGGKRSGKTFGALQFALAAIAKFPGISIAYVRDTWKTSGEATKEIRELIEKEFTQRDEKGNEIKELSLQFNSERIWCPWNKSEIVLASAQDEGTAKFLWSRNWWAMIFDEYTHLDPAIVEFGALQVTPLKKRNSRTLKIYCFNPDGDHVYDAIRRFHLGEVEDETQRGFHPTNLHPRAELVGQDTWLYEDENGVKTLVQWSNFQDNHALDQDKYLRESILQTTDKSKRQRLGYGSIKAISGRVYPTFDREIHVRHYELSPHAKHYHFGDWGINRSAQTLYRLSIDINGHQHISKELYEHSLTCRGYHELAIQRGFQVIGTTTILDPSTEQNERDGQSVASDLRGWGWTIVTEGVNKSFLPRIDKVQRLLGVDCNGMPGLTIELDCVNLIREFEEDMWRDGHSEPIKKRGDGTPLRHALDPLEYFETWWGASGVPKVPEVQKSFDERQQEIIKKSNERSLGLMVNGAYERSKDRVVRGGFTPNIGHRGVSKVSEFK